MYRQLPPSLLSRSGMKFTYPFVSISNLCATFHCQQIFLVDRTESNTIGWCCARIQLKSYSAVYALGKQLSSLASFTGYDAKCFRIASGKRHPSTSKWVKTCDDWVKRKLKVSHSIDSWLYPVLRIRFSANSDLGICAPICWAFGKSHASVSFLTRR
jgi:hypothetical protein